MERATLNTYRGSPWLNRPLGKANGESPRSFPGWRVHLGNAPVGSARSCRVRGRGSVVECGSPLPLCDLRTKDRPYAPRAEAKAPEGWRTPKASPRRGASAGAVCGCAPPRRNRIARLDELGVDGDWLTRVQTCSDVFRRVVCKRGVKCHVRWIGWVPKIGCDGVLL